MEIRMAISMVNNNRSALDARSGQSEGVRFGRNGRPSKMVMMDNDQHTKFETLTQRVSSGDAQAADEMLEMVYAQLRGVAGQMMKNERPGQTIGATALVHEAYIRLSESEGLEWESTRHFFNAAALAMRRCLIDRARRKGRVKHGGEIQRVDMDVVDIPASDIFDPDQMEQVHDALNELESHNARWAEVVNLRIFLGLTIQQTADAMRLSPATVKSDYRFSLAWIKSKLSGPDGEQNDDPSGHSS